MTALYSVLLDSRRIPPYFRTKTFFSAPRGYAECCRTTWSLTETWTLTGGGICSRRGHQPDRSLTDQVINRGITVFKNKFSGPSTN